MMGCSLILKIHHGPGALDHQLNGFFSPSLGATLIPCASAFTNLKIRYIFDQTCRNVLCNSLDIIQLKRSLKNSAGVTANSGALKIIIIIVRKIQANKYRSKYSKQGSTKYRSQEKDSICTLAQPA